jgi:hypothetical protein
VVVSAAVRFAFAKAHPAPWIFSDELVYAGLAQSVADSGHFALRDAPGLQGFGPGYPLLIAPAYAIFDDLAHAYAAAKAINAVLMSLAAVPVYLIARRVVSVPLALVSAALALAIPSFLYTGTIMTENAFYPAFCLALLGLLAALELPTLWRQLGALALVFVAFLIRAQAVTLVLAFATAIVLVCLVEARVAGRLSRRDLTRRLLEYRVTWIALAGGALLVLGAGLVRGRSPSQVLGGYRGLLDFDYDVGQVARWFLLHAGELDLYVGVLPFAAFIALVLRSLSRADMPRPLRLFGLLGVSVAVWMTLVVAATASFFASAAPGRIEERNLFHIVPLLLIALLVWVEAGLPRFWPAAALAALLAGALPGVVPYNQFADISALSDTLAMIPLWNLVFFGHIEAGSLTPLVVTATLAAAALYLLLPRKLALFAPALVLLWFLVLTNSVEHQMRATSRGVLAQGISTRREWIDEAVGPSARVAAVWSGYGERQSLLQSWFFNRSVQSIYALGGVPPASERPTEHPATFLEDTGVLQADGRPVRADYALVDQSLELVGPEVARDRGRGIALYRVDGKVRARKRVTGIYSDSLTGPEASYTLWRCRGGRLTVEVASERNLFTTPQAVLALSGERTVGRLRIRPGEEKSLIVPMRAEDGHCSVTLRVSPTAVPAQVLGTPDFRALGVRLTRFEYRPPSG